VAKTRLRALPPVAQNHQSDSNIGTVRNTFDCAMRQSFCSSRGAMKLAMIGNPVSPERQVYHE
jgi:hypothetical protein